MRAVVAEELPLGHKRLVVKGMRFRDGDPIDEPLPPNPWGLAPHVPLDEALVQIWGRLPEAKPLLDELRKRVLGLVLLEGTGGPFLGYLRYHERDRYELDDLLFEKPRPPFDRRAALDWEPFGDVSMFIGYPPVTSLPSLRPDVVVPPALRYFYAVHGGIKDGMWWLYPPDQLDLWNRMLNHPPGTVIRSDDPAEQRTSDQFLGLFSYGDDRTDLFDLSEGDDDPPVCMWCDGGLGTGGQSWDDWFQERISLIVASADD